MPAKPRPTNLRLIEGRGNGRDSGGRPVKPSPGFVRLPPTAPAWLDGAARALWDQVVSELQRLELLKPVDAAALAGFCMAWQRFVDANAEISRAGMFIETERGPVKHPAVMIAEAASKELRAWAGEFGLTPSAENRLGKAAGTDGDDDDNPYA